MISGYDVEKISYSGFIFTVAGSLTISYSGDNSCATSVTLNQPSTISSDSDSNCSIMDSGNYRLNVVTADAVLV